MFPFCPNNQFIFNKKIYIIVVGWILDIWVIGIFSTTKATLLYYNFFDFKFNDARAYEKSVHTHYVCSKSSNYKSQAGVDGSDTKFSVSCYCPYYYFNYNKKMQLL